MRKEWWCLGKVCMRWLAADSSYRATTRARVKQDASESKRSTARDGRVQAEAQVPVLRKMDRIIKKDA
jgi:hypothetical protein